MFYEGSIKDKKLLLHCCCGPCSLGAIPTLLDEGADITLFYYNPCIFDGEVQKRYLALREVAERFHLPLIVPEQSHEAFVGYAADHAPEPEGGPRCRLCMGDRLSGAAAYADENGFDVYTTTLTVSPHKNAELIFSLARANAENGTKTPFLARDFKKKNGFLMSCTLSREMGIYRQRFCGCEYSAKLAGIDVYEYSHMIRQEYSNIQMLRSEEW